VNLGLATRLQAPCILVADIDRGGVFAAVTGTFQLLDRAEAPLVRSFLVNRFRGDSSLFSDGVPILEEKAGRPCLGVFPFLPGIHLDPEDSLSLEDRLQPICTTTHELRAESRVAVIRFPHISNFTDFQLLPNAVYVARPVNVRFDTIILPGTKSTIEDLLWLRESGMERWLFERIEMGSRVIGVCGGYQMLGEQIVDPHGAESTVREIRGLGLLPATTQLTKGKLTRTVSARTPSGICFSGYEIHMGITTLRREGKPFAVLEDGSQDGVRADRITGTYLHGALENRAVLEELLGHSLQERPWLAKDAHYDRLASWFAEHANLEVLKSEYGL
jgi:adenosylcobyric acid synthase